MRQKIRGNFASWNDDKIVLKWGNNCGDSDSTQMYMTLVVAFTET
jgi:hypothetical protein